MIIQDITVAAKQRKRNYKSYPIGYKNGGQPYIIDTAKVEKAKRYQANMAAGKTRKQADNLQKLLSDPVHSENYEKLKKVVRAYNTIGDLLRNNNTGRDEAKQLLQLRRNIEFVALNMNNSFSEWYSPLSPKQMVYVEKALALVEQNPELFI